MEKEQFKIGERFYTATGPWICVDVGTRSIVAVKEQEAVEYYSAHTIFPTDLMWRTNVSDNYDLFGNMVFSQWDFGGCRLKNTFSDPT